MRVMAKEMCFIEGARRRPMEEFDYKGNLKRLSKSCVVVGLTANDDQGESVDDDEGDVGLTANEIRAQLVAAGVQFQARANKAELIALLEETIRVNAPASSGAPDKSLQSIT